MLSEHLTEPEDESKEESPVYTETIALENKLKKAKQELATKHLEFLQELWSGNSERITKAETEYKTAKNHWADIIGTEKIIANIDDENVKSLLEKKKPVVAISICKINNERWALINKYEKLLKTAIKTFETINTSFGYKPAAKEEKTDNNETAVIESNNTSSAFYSSYFSLWKVPVVTTIATHAVSRVKSMFSPFKRS